jgi:hypothetical protein
MQPGFQVGSWQLQEFNMFDSCNRKSDRLPIHEYAHAHYATGC